MNNTIPKVDNNGPVYEFAGKVPEELVCKLCSKVLRDPRQVVCCGAHYCQACIEKRIITNYTCPSCKTQSFNHFRDVHFEQRVNTLKVYCPHHKKGCKWMGELSGVKVHLTGNPGCGYALSPCPNKCQMALPRKDMREHLVKQCEFRKVRCQYCSHEDTFKTINNEHTKTCVNYPMRCPYSCGAKGIRRADLPKHEDGCPLRPVECPFQKAGCKIRPHQKDLSEHLAINSPAHIEMMSKSLDSLQSRVQKSEKEAASKAEELEKLHAVEESSRRIVGKKLLAIAGNADELLKTCSESQRFAIQSIRSLTDEAFHLKDIGQPIVFQMVNFSEFKRSGKMWYSAPFYVGDGYKMCLAVNPSGSGAGQGMFVSISLCLMQGEFDEELNWPIELPFHLIVEGLHNDSETGSNVAETPKTYMYFHSDTPQGRVDDNILLEVRKCENFVTNEQVENLMLYYDTLTFQITGESEFL
jgi:TNF receptor-associated factor 4